MQFYSVLLLTCEEELFDNTRVYWCQPFVFKKIHTEAHRSSMVASILLRVLSSTEDQEARELLVELQQQNEVFVLMGPAIAVTNVGTASEFLAHGWSTEVLLEEQGQNKKTLGRRAQNTQLHQRTRRDDDFQHFLSDTSGTRGRRKISQKRQNLKTTKMKKKSSHYPTCCQYEGK